MGWTASEMLGPRVSFLGALILEFLPKSTSLLLGPTLPATPPPHTLLPASFASAKPSV